MARNNTEFTKSRELREMTVSLTFADSTPTKMFRLPAGSRIVDWVVNVKTAFDGTTPILDVGSLADPDAILDALAVATAGRVAITTELILPAHEVTQQTDVYGQVTGTTVTEGALDLTCVFSVNKLTRM